MKPHTLTKSAFRAGHGLLALAVLVAPGCMGDDDDGGSSGVGPASDAGAGSASNPHSPRFLSLGTNVMSITEGQAVTFTAVVTDPDGIDDLIGGSLTSTDGKIQYGAFATASQEGAYSLQLSWNAMNQADAITFGTMEGREFRAVFFDVAGNTAEQNVTIRLTCQGKAACAGDCTSACGLVSEQRESCSQACMSFGATCYPAGPHRAYYDFGNATVAHDLADCTTVPAATDGTYPFVALTCRCIPPN
jgi:hypothetical protein